MPNRAAQAAASEAETEELLLMIAQNESKRMENERVQKERALKQAAELKKIREKVYDDIIFDSSAIKDIHPRLTEVKVCHIRDIESTIYPDSVQIDGEYFMDVESDEEEH